MADRFSLRAAIQSGLEPRSDVLALWEGGSASFDRDDEYSDVDLQAYVEDGSLDSVVLALEEILESSGPVEFTLLMPQPTFHGVWQKFYKIVGDPFLIVDICIIERSQEWKFTEVERHGRPIILFDKDGLVTTSRVDQAELAVTLAAKLDRISSTVEMFHCFVDKDLLRGRPVDAFHWYNRVLLYPLVDLLRMIHTPEKHDYALRYVHQELPTEMAERIAELAYVSSPDDLPAKKEAALEMIRAAVGTLRTSHSVRT